MMRDVRCFVIGPIGDKLADHDTVERELYEESVQTWENVIEPACRACDLVPLRADMIAKTGEILEQICSHLRDDEVVVADLTRANPNVMYELGLRHTTGKVTVQIGEHGRLPFDVAAIRTIGFRRTESGMVTARKNLQEALEAALNGEYDPVTPTRVWLGVGPRDEGNTTSATEEAEDEEGFLDTLAAAESAIQELGAVVTALAVPLTAISDAFQRAVSAASKSDATGGGFSGRLALTSRLSSELEAEEEKMAPLIEKYEGMMRTIAPGIDLLVTRLENEEQGADVETFLDQMITFSRAVVESVEMTITFCGSLLEIGKLSKALRRTTTRIDKLLKKYRDASAPATNWLTGLKRLRERPRAS